MLGLILKPGKLCANAANGIHTSRRVRNGSCCHPAEEDSVTLGLYPSEDLLYPFHPSPAAVLEYPKLLSPHSERQDADVMGALFLPQERYNAR